MGRQIIVVILLTVMALCSNIGKVYAADTGAAVIGDEPLVVFFDKGESTVSDVDKDRIKKLVANFRLTAGDKIIVVGHSDSSGDAQANIKLSYKRAQAVRHQIISTMGGKVGENILAVARGSENPVGDNSSQSGRAQNRRVEIHYAQMLSGRLMVNNRRVTSDMVAVQRLVQDARALLRRQQFGEALRVLQEAYSKGGDQFSNWHAVYGIAGYYAGVASEKVRNHLSLALRLDPYNDEARDYLGRLEACERVAAGLVTPLMGRSPKDPIAILCDAQAHEYLRLFGVQPLSHAHLARGGIDVWRCRDANGELVTYHFDRSKVYQDLYDQWTPGASIPTHSVAPEAFPSAASGGSGTIGVTPLAVVSETSSGSTTIK